MTKENKITITIDLEPIKKDIEKYIKRKIHKKIREEYEDEIDVGINLPNIKFPEIEKRLESLEEWKDDIKQGWTK